ncbi:hypothetical protein ACFX2G_006134 [Malus domestica]
MEPRRASAQANWAEKNGAENWAEQKQRAEPVFFNGDVANDAGWARSIKGPTTTTRFKLLTKSKKLQKMRLRFLL